MELVGFTLDRIKVLQDRVKLCELALEIEARTQHIEDGRLQGPHGDVCHEFNDALSPMCDANIGKRVARMIAAANSARKADSAQ